MSSITYRPFRNTDPPCLAELWNFARLGPGAALEFSNDTFDTLVLAQPYFDRMGLICACEGREVVGFAHAGFGPSEQGTQLDKRTGVICAVIVRADYRRRGIGRELMARAEQYLRGEGAMKIFAGESPLRNPFYLGLYGGADSAGFLESDQNARPFFEALGYNARQKYLLFEREISDCKPPFDPRALAIKRTMKFGILDRPPGATWWWMTRHGRFESLTFTLVPASGESCPALLTCWGMELQAATRGRRTVGITDLFVVPERRRQGYARVLLCEVIRRLRDDLINYVETVVPAENAAARQLFEGLGFRHADTGVVYERPQ
jgi:ribosomal protein S18 acetylase RimI-like enzyme